MFIINFFIKKFKRNFVNNMVRYSIVELFESDNLGKKAFENEPTRYYTFFSIFSIFYFNQKSQI